MSAFNPNAYGPQVATLLRDVPFAPLDAGIPRAEARKTLAALTTEKLFAGTDRPIRDENMASACLSALWLRYNYLDESHRLSQEIDTPTGSFWHGILHRREGDFGNARYWFNRVGAHPIFPTLNTAAIGAGWPNASRWNPRSLVDQVEKALRAGEKSPETKLCLAVQQLEWELLFDFSWNGALMISQ